MLALAGACDSDRCQPAAGCSDCASAEQADRCRYDQLLALPADDHAQVLRIGATIDDPILRGAAVAGWSERHGRSLPLAVQESLCTLLSGSQRRACERRVASPHLQR